MRATPPARNFVVTVDGARSDGTMLRVDGVDQFGRPITETYALSGHAPVRSARLAHPLFSGEALRVHLQECHKGLLRGHGTLVRPSSVLVEAVWAGPRNKEALP